MCNILRQQGDVVQTMFGGSVRRGTDVNGLSDVDVLLIVNQSSLLNQQPAQAIEYVKNAVVPAFAAESSSSREFGSNRKLLRWH